MRLPSQHQAPRASHGARQNLCYRRLPLGTRLGLSFIPESNIGRSSEPRFRLRAIGEAGVIQFSRGCVLKRRSTMFYESDEENVGCFGRPRDPLMTFARVGWLSHWQ